MNTLKSTLIVVILAILILPTLAIADLIKALQGKLKLDEEWHETYVYGRINSGQGRKDL